MADKFDPYREALIVENCADLEYVRVLTGFCRQITVTEEDLQRLEA